MRINKTLAILTLAVMATSPAISQARSVGMLPSNTMQTESLNFFSRYVSEGETETIKLDGFRYVEKLFVQAEGASSRDGMIEVIVNGETKGTIYVPGRDPSYVVTVKETTNSIQFRHISGGSVRVINVKAVMSESAGRDWENRASNPISWPVNNEAMAVAKKAIAIVNEFDQYTSYAVEGKVLLPIKKQAARLYAKAMAKGASSYGTVQALAALGAQIELSCKFIDQSMESEATFELATELLTLNEQIKEILR